MKVNGGAVFQMAKASTTEPTEINTLELSKTASNMVRENNNTATETFIVVSSLTVYLKATENIYGQTAVHIEEISSKVSVQVMEFGKLALIEWRAIRVITLQIKSKVMEYTHGTMDGHIEVILIMTFEMDLESCLIAKIEYSMQDNGLMGTK